MHPWPSVSIYIHLGSGAGQLPLHISKCLQKHWQASLLCFLMQSHYLQLLSLFTCPLHMCAAALKVQDKIVLFIKFIAHCSCLHIFSAMQGVRHFKVQPLLQTSVPFLRLAILRGKIVPRVSQGWHLHQGHLVMSKHRVAEHLSAGFMEPVAFLLDDKIEITGLCWLEVIFKVKPNH